MDQMADQPPVGLDGKVTVSVVVTCIVAATSGLIFGYDIGISGGVTTMVPFLQKFFPSVLKKAAEAKTSIYCLYDSQLLTAFTSSLYLAGLVSSLAAGRLTAALGRKNTMVLGGCTFFVGAALNGFATNIVMLILGRLLLGFGVGFTTQATPIYLSEMAPPKWRGACNTGFQLFMGVGVVLATCVNFSVAKYSRGWRFALGFAMVPAAIMTIGALLIPDTPSSLVKRGKTEQARKSLANIRGTDNVDAELDDLIKTSELAAAANQERSFKTLLQRRYRPHLVMAFAIPFFQQITGINVVAFYAPVLFQSVGFGNGGALLAAIILGLVNVFSIFVSTALVDRRGRRFLFVLGGTQMFVCELAMAWLMAATTGVTGSNPMSKEYAVLMLILMCIYAAGFGWSWGPLGWLVPSEIFPMNIRPMGQSISVAVHFGTTFVLSQSFLAMLCHLKYGTFLFYGCWIATMTIFVVVLLPETKGIALDSMDAVWENHWFWQRFVQDSPKPKTNIKNFFCF